MVTKKKTIELKAITGKHIKNHYLFKQHSCEADIEYLWRDMCHQLFENTSVNLISNKKKIKSFTNSKAQTDGELLFTLTTSNMLHEWRMIQETKYGKSANCTNEGLKNQLVQAIGYDYLNNKNLEVGDLIRHYDCFILNSEKYFCYVLKKDIEELINDLYSLFDNYSGNPSSLYKDKDIMKLVYNTKVDFKIYKLTDDFNFTEVFKEIMKKCK